MRNNTQMELGLAAQICPSVTRRKKVSRPQWWFNQMRQVVEQAVEWKAGSSDGQGQQLVLQGKN